MDGFRTKKEYPLLCLHCGACEPGFVFIRDDETPSPFGRCVKCSNKAHTMTLGHMGEIVRSMAMEIVKIKLDMIDLQDPEGTDR
jgi:hypothetical protein